MKNLEELDKDLYLAYKGECSDIKDFEKKSKSNKLSFIEGVLMRTHQLIEKHGECVVNKNDENSLLSNYAHIFARAYKIFSNDYLDYAIGWHCDYGGITAHFKNENGEIHVSYSSQSHPTKTNEHRWIFFKTKLMNIKDYMNENPITKEPSEEEKKQFIHDNFLPK